MNKMMQVDWKRHDRLLVALIIAAFLHALIILGIRFDLPKPKEIDKSLDVVLVVKPALKPPVRAEFLAPEPQKGGGEAVKKALPMAIPNPLPAVQPQPDVPKIAPPPRHIAEKQPLKKPAMEASQYAEESPSSHLDSEPTPVMTQARSEKKITASGGENGQAEVAPVPKHLSADLLSQQIAEVTSEFNKSRELQAKQSRSGFITAPKFQPFSFMKFENASFITGCSQFSTVSNTWQMAVNCSGVSASQRFSMVFAS
jgi:protein TonB